MDILGTYSSYHIFSKADYVYYTIYESKYAWILDKIWEEELSARFNQDIGDYTDDWDAEKAFRNGIGTYYVRYEDAILVLREEVDVSLTPEQMAVICEKLELK